MATDDPIESFASLFESSRGAPPRRPRARVGEVVSARVVKVGKDAVFFEIDGQRQAFMEAIDLRAPDGTLRVEVGSVLRARIIEADPDAGIRLAPTPESAAAAGASVGVGGPAQPDAVKIAVGQVVSGAVTRVELYGVFLQIEGTQGRAGRGLLPLSELGVARGTDLRKAFPLAAKLKAKVIDLSEGKTRLSLRALKDDEERAQFDGFKQTEKAAPPLGTLGELLMKARKAT